MSTHPLPHAGRDKVAASFARKSTPDDQGIADQHDLLRHRAQEDGYVLPDDAMHRFSENDVSGVATERAGLSRLLELARSGNAPFTRVYVKDRTRFGRWSDPRKHFWYEVELEEHGVQVCYLDEGEPMNFDDASPDESTAKFLYSAFGNIVSAQERKRLIKRVTTGLRSRIRADF